MTPEKLKLLKDFISKQRKFSIKGYEGDALTLREFIDRFHTGNLSKLDNIFDDNNKVMNRGSMRSVIDTIIVCLKHHDCTIQDVANVFKQAAEEKTIKGHYCNMIERVVLRTNYAGWSMNAQGNLLDVNLPDVTYEDFIN